MCYGRLVFAEMPLEIRQYETDTHSDTRGEAQRHVSTGWQLGAHQHGDVNTGPALCTAAWPMGLSIQ